MKLSTVALLPLIALVAACGDSGGSSAGAVAVVSATPTPAATATPTPTPTATPTPAATPTPTPTASGFTAQAAAMYTAGPSIANCTPGQLTSSVTNTLLTDLNTIRAFHKLPPVTYSPGDEAAAQASALMQAANDSLSHTPPTSWKCYSSLGDTGSSTSNLYGGFGNGLTLISEDEVLAGWLTETNNIVADSVGHRRWLLYPFLGSVAYGRVAGASPTQTRGDAAALKVFNNTGSGVANGTLPPYVAYPYQDYPARYFATTSLLSFSVIASSNPNSSANSTVNFANARVTVTQRGGSALTVSNQTYDNQGYGLPNNLQFAVAGLRTGTYYDVTITGVVVSGATQSYSYYFRIV
ncbi:CAP domain-containing protein [Sphingomonas sp.]|uniref:CAP domain-containing protein n=1 Tax=Sphingomonas sp. TaxID=28214 RepID=UPI003CC6827E